MYRLTGNANTDLLLEAQRAHCTGNYSDAENLYRLATENGNADTKYSIGSMYTYGEGMIADY